MVTSHSPELFPTLSSDSILIPIERLKILDRSPKFPGSRLAMLLRVGVTFGEI
jgi:hypothetical protein